MNIQSAPLCLALSALPGIVNHELPHRHARIEGYDITRACLLASE
jgi:hypothetical protein